MYHRRKDASRTFRKKNTPQPPRECNSSDGHLLAPKKHRGQEASGVSPIPNLARKHLCKPENASLARFGMLGNKSEFATHFLTRFAAPLNCYKIIAWLEETSRPGYSCCNLHDTPVLDFVCASNQHPLPMKRKPILANPLPRYPFRHQR